MQRTGRAFLWCMGLMFCGGLGLSEDKAKDARDIAQGGDMAGVEQLVSEQKYQAASEELKPVLQAAIQGGDAELWTRCLVLGVQLRVGLHQYEDAVRHIRETPWPDGQDMRAILFVCQAAALDRYATTYSPDTRDREKMAAGGETDFTVWTREEIDREILRLYAGAWECREDLGEREAADYDGLIVPSNCPEQIRGTVRDALTYLFADFLAHEPRWTQSHRAAARHLPLEGLLLSGESSMPPLDLSDVDVHPLSKICFLLSDLARWHRSEGRKEAELEARLEAVRRLEPFCRNGERRAAVAAHLEALLPSYRDVPWWSTGQAEYAEWLRAMDGPDSLIRARTAARDGVQAYPDSLGAKRCTFLFETIEMPGFRLDAKAVDRLGAACVHVSHKNVEKLFFRAYRLDLEKQMKAEWPEHVGWASAVPFLPADSAIIDLIEDETPVASWSLDLPGALDYRIHKTFVSPPIESPGVYAVVASLKKGFPFSKRNRIQSVCVTLGELILLTEKLKEGVQVRVVSGVTGNPIQGASVSLCRRREETVEKISDASGVVYFPFDRESGGGFFLPWATQEDQVAVGTHWELFEFPPEEEIPGCLVYTDRSAYRPGQQVHWKIVAYTKKPPTYRPIAATGSKVSVALTAAKRRRVASETVTANEYGSASGTFEIPEDCLLGNWTLSASWKPTAHNPYRDRGVAQIRVEEYKRPTFEVKIEDPPHPLRVEGENVIAGQARTFLGAPLSEGQVRWTVFRQTVHPWWWQWRDGRWLGTVGGSKSGAKAVAQGTGQVNQEGRFEFAFCERDDLPLPEDPSLRHRYEVVAEIMDRGGETEEARRFFVLGDAGVQCEIGQEKNFFLEGDAPVFSLLRADLDGVPRAGQGRWRLVSVKQPKVDDWQAGGGSGREWRDVHRQSGRKRTEPERRFSPPAAMRQWEDGEEVASGAAEHDGTGKAFAQLPSLEQGCYRLHYETTDDFGARCQTCKEFLVTGARPMNLAVPLLLLSEGVPVRAGGVAKILAVSGLPNQLLYLEVFRRGRLAEHHLVRMGRDSSFLEIPVLSKDRGGIAVRLTAVRDYRVMMDDLSVFVPWDDKELNVELASFRDTLRPGQEETWKVTVKSRETTGAGGGACLKAAELLAYMYDRSLESFKKHRPPLPSLLYPCWMPEDRPTTTLGGGIMHFLFDGLGFQLPCPSLEREKLMLDPRYAVGGPGLRAHRIDIPPSTRWILVLWPPPRADGDLVVSCSGPNEPDVLSLGDLREEDYGEYDPWKVELGEIPQFQGREEGTRADFRETAFWFPHLITDQEGSASLEFTLPDSVTSWEVWVHALTRDFRSGVLRRGARSAKELMVRPYLPRFLREGDEALLKVMVSNLSGEALDGKVVLHVLDPRTEENISRPFIAAEQLSMPFHTEAGGHASVSFPVSVPNGLRETAFRLVAKAGEYSDGEMRALPILPSRMHLVQSRSVALRGQDERTMTFQELAAADDPSLVNENMVVTVEGQLFYCVMDSLAYIIFLPPESTDALLHKLLYYGILSSLYDAFPAAKRFADGDIPYKRPQPLDPNQRMALDETPWYGYWRKTWSELRDDIYSLPSSGAMWAREDALDKLRKAQQSSGGFPWLLGGAPSPHITLYLLHGFAKGTEFQVEIPRDMVRRAWSYMRRYYVSDEVQEKMSQDCCWEMITFLNYTLTCYPDSSWIGGAFSEKDRKEMLDFCFRHWREHSPMLKGQLALTLMRFDRPKDAQLVLDSIMDSAKTDPDLGTFWAPEEKSWLWYNDTIETHAFMLRALSELDPKDSRRHGIVQWLFLNRKCNRWHSSMATAEAVTSIAHYLRAEGAMDVPEGATVILGDLQEAFAFDPDEYTGRRNHIVLEGEEIDPQAHSNIVVKKETPGFLFASAAWHFSTEELPDQEHGDFFHVSREFFRRENVNGEWTLTPLEEGSAVAIGDEIEVQLTLQSKHEADYVHLRDPRAAGLEPDMALSGYRFHQGLCFYEEVRDSGANFFFERLPVGEYLLKHRLRANMAGTFRVGPATVQCTYAPEVNAYSSGCVLEVK